MYLFQGKHHPCKRRVERGGKPGAGTAGHQIFFFRLSTVQQTRNTLPRHCSQLDRRAFPSQRETSEDTQETSQKFCRQHPLPLLGKLAEDLSLHLRDSAPGDHWFKLYQLSHHQCHQDQNSHPSQDPKRILSDKSKDLTQRISRKSQSQPVEQHDQSGCCPHQKSLSDQYDREPLCPSDRMRYVFFHDACPFLLPDSRLTDGSAWKTVQ